jgi:hypothetical protein
MSRSYTSSPPCASMACSGTSLQISQYIQHEVLTVKCSYFLVVMAGDMKTVSVSKRVCCSNPTSLFPSPSLSYAIFFFPSKDWAHWARSETADQVNLSY